MGKILVATIWGHEPIMKAVAKYDIEKVILVHERSEEAKKEDWENKKKSIEKVKDSLESVINVEARETELNDLYKVSSDVSETLNEEKDKEVILNITGGKKLQAIGSLIAAYSADNVEKIIYWSEENNKWNIIPKFDLSIRKKTKEVLKGIKEGLEPKDIAKSSNMSNSMVYKHLKKLREKDYAKKDKKWAVTEVGEFVLAVDKD